MLQNDSLNYIKWLFWINLAFDMWLPNLPTCLLRSYIDERWVV